MKYTKLIYMPLIALMGSCVDEFNPDFDNTPIAVLNALIQADSTVSVSVSRSFTTLDGSNGGESVERNIIKNAVVTLFINGQDLGKMTYDPSSLKYNSTVKAKSKDIVTIKVTTKDYGSAEGTTSVPDKIKNAGWSYTASVEIDYDTTIIYPGGESYHPEVAIINYSVTFQDTADEENYYMLYSNDLDFECKDPIIGENDTPLDAIYTKYTELYFFSDKSISGKEYTINFSCRYSKGLHYFPGNGTDKIINKVGLYSISRDYYLYLLSIHKKYEGLNGMLEDFGISEPKVVYTNVSPGIGIVAAETPVCYIENDVTDIVNK